MLKNLIKTKGRQVENCWEFFNCPEKVRSKCRIFISDLGSDCWLISRSDDADKHHKNCIDCPWFKEKNTDFVKFYQSTQ